MKAEVVVVAFFRFPSSEVLEVTFADKVRTK